MPRPRYRKKTHKAKNGKEYTYFVRRLYDERLPRGELDIQGKTQKELDEKIEMKKRELDKGLTPGKEKFGEYTKAYFDTVHGQELSYGTITRYAGLYNKYIKDSFLGKTPLKNITGIKVQAYINELHKKGVNSKTLGLILCIIKPTISYAVIQGQLPNDFTSSLRIPSSKNTLSERRGRFIPDDVSKRLIEEVKGDDVLNPLVVTAINSGLRRGELLALTWSEIDPVACTISVNHSYDHHQKKVSSTKTPYSIRKVPVSPQLIDILEQHKQKQKEDKRKLGKHYQDKNLVFCNNAGEYLSPSTIDRHLKKVSSKIGSEMINMHDFRHTFSTRVAKYTSDPSIAKAILGHKDLKTTLEYYRSVEEDEKRSCTDKIDFIG